MTIVDERIDNRRVRIVQEIDRDQRPLFICENPAERCLGRLFEEPIHFGNVRGPLHLEHAIRQRSIEQRHADRDSIQLALQLGIDQSDRGRRAGGRRNERHQRGSGAPQIFVRQIDHGLRVGDVVDGGDHAVTNPDSFVDHLHHRSQTVGRA